MESKDILNVAVIQFDIEWENTSANLQRLSSIIINANQQFDLLVLPEMFHCGFTMTPKQCCESMDGIVVNWMKDVARQHFCAVCGSVVIEENNRFFNRLLFVLPDGTLHFYDKRHLFRMGGEHEIYSSGSESIIINYKGWRIKPLICYDLRFPVWSRNCNDYDMLIYVANWPTPRREAWNVLLKARAVENQCFVIGVNRIGSDRYVSYSGDSVALDAKGQVVYNADNAINELNVFSLDINSLHSFREKFPVYLDSDKFKII
jgi:predicted amidohydrolase